jgi:hypothetical protein
VPQPIPGRRKKKSRFYCSIRRPRQSRQQAVTAATSETALKFTLRIYDKQHDDLRFKAWCAERDFDRDFLHEQGLRCITRGVLVEALEFKSAGRNLK